MNNVNMAGMNNMGGPVGGGMPMMNNGATAGGIRPPMPANADQRAQLNTYIYEYFLRNHMYDCARSLLTSEQPINVLKESPGSRRNEGDDADGDSKDDIDSKRPDDLPLPNVPKDAPESCFLYEWWCLFWDMFNAQRGKGDGRAVMQYVTHTQQQSRLRQENQVAMLRGIKGDVNNMPQYQQMMMRGQNGLAMQQNNELRQKAIQNNRNGTPQQQMQMQMLAQQQQQKQQQMQRDPSEGNGQRPQSPGSGENAPSPSKRPRLEGPFNQQQQMPNGRGQSQGMPQQVGETGPSNAIQAAHLQLTNGIEPNNLTAQQFQNIPGGANAQQQRSLAGYQAGLAAQQAGQMPVKPGMPGQPGGPQNQGSPMMAQGQNPNSIADYYNPQEMGPNGMRGAPGNQANGSGGNHALQDYQMQLMLLEQQNKKRLMMARQEQDSMAIPRPDGPGGPGMGSNGQPFQGASPQGPRSVNSPNPSEQMKRGTPHMNPGGMPSPGVAEGQSRGSPNNMNFNIPGGGAMDPQMDPKFYQMNGMGPNMVPGGMPNGMRPPSSHPGGGFNNQMAQAQMQMAQQRGQNWQGGPNGQMVQPGQAAPQQNMGTPQQRAMPPPSAPAANANANGRTQPPSPQQGTAAPPTPSQTNKANPKKKKGETKGEQAKRTAAKKGSAPNNAGATPSADAPTDNPTPTPQTPITPVHASSFQKNQQNGTVQPATNGQAAAAPVNTGVPVQQPDMNFDMTNNMSGFDTFQPLGDFTQPGNGSMDVLQDFDFDSFLHQDGDGVDNFNFDASGFLDDGGQISAE
ncbi:Transcriptional activator somA [Lachnellula suecica]|uniref:Transcriptional activator somA n=1 Tax=Lachnellula suecica TaxID=602035 RepID=A0A8T9BXP4_9HELO|nr:Transcriptional activator somA [Lachnellula suecica]